MEACDSTLLPRVPEWTWIKKLGPNQILLWHKRGPSNFSWWFWNLRQRCRKLFEFKWTVKSVLSIISPLVWIGLIDHPLAKPLILYAVRVFGPFFFKSILAHRVGSGWSLKITRFIRTAFINAPYSGKKGQPNVTETIISTSWQHNQARRKTFGNKYILIEDHFMKQELFLLGPKTSVDK